MKRFAVLLLIIPALLLAAGCGGARGERPDHLIDPDGNVILYVSNQSRAADPVQIEIFVDGSEVAADSFEHGDGHNFREYRLRLSPGRHTMRVQTASGQTSLTKSFLVLWKRWIAVDYWYSPGGEYGSVEPSHFTWLIRNSQIWFM